jgi:hypothetical protein
VTYEIAVHSGDNIYDYKKLSKEESGKVDKFIQDEILPGQHRIVGMLILGNTKKNE